MPPEAASSPPLLSEFPRISAPQICSVLESLSKGRAAGPDSLKNELFLGCSLTFSEMLCPFFDLYLRESRFPLEWKSVVVNPVYKSGDKMSVSNYRPITLSSVVLKILERCLYKPLLEFLDSHNVIPPSQFGFRPYRSVQDQLILTIDFISRGLNSCKNVIGVLRFTKSVR